MPGAARWLRGRRAGPGRPPAQTTGGSPAPAIEPGPVTAVHQFLPALLPGDAVGSHTLQLRRAVQDLGLESEIFVESVHPSLEGEALLHTEFPARAKGSVIVYQFATGSVLADVAQARPEPLVIDYHNVTPDRYFRPWDPMVAAALSLARAQLDMLSPRTALGLADSSFNEAELVERGYARTAVVPILLDFPTTFGHDVDGATLDRLAAAKERGGADLLFVGRVAPNKAQHDLIKALVAYRALYDPAARLHLVGRVAADSYGQGLHRFVAELGLSDAVELADHGVSDAELSAYYASADVLVSCSEHEGFCLPLLEAMYHRVPIVAYGAAAVPETVGDAGVVLADKSPLTVAAAVHRVLTDAVLGQALVDAGQGRLAEFSLDRSRAKLAAALAPLTGVDFPPATATAVAPGPSPAVAPGPSPAVAPGPSPAVGP